MEKIEIKTGKLKTAIVSLGARITLDSKNVRSVDLCYMRDYLLNVIDRDTVDFVSKKTKKEEGIEYYKDIKYTDLNNYDEVYLYNNTLNIFGGVFQYESLLTFEKLYNFNGDIFYLLADPKMPCLDYSTFIKSRDKNGLYQVKCDNKEGVYNFNKEILDNWSDKVWKNIIIAHTGQDYKLYVDTWNLENPKKIGQLNSNCKWFNFWLFEYYAINEQLDLKLKTYNGCNKYDLVYFGNNRQNERNKLIKSLYNIKELSKYCVGFDLGLDNSEFTDYVKHEDLFNIIGENCLATVIIGDNLHNNNIRTARFFESMLLDIVAFIYIKFDENKTYVQNEFLKDFIYISSNEELKEKINQIKSDKELYNRIVELERQEIINQFGQYKKNPA